MPRRPRRPPAPGSMSSLAPLRILSQIFMLQFIYYASAAILITFTALVAGAQLSPDLILNWRSLRGDTTVGWMLGLVWVLNALVGVIALLMLIARSKLILDFALTLHFLHLVVTSLYSKGIPRNALWWGLQVVSAGVMTTLGVWSCRWRELRPINFGANTAAASAGNAEVRTEGDEEMGFQRGRGRGRGRDGAGEYEMVGMKGSGDGG